MKNINFSKRIICLFILSFLFIFQLAYASSNTSTLRIISLSPNLTETIIKLGGLKYLVGKSSAGYYIKGTEDIPIAGSMGTPNPEIVLRLRPSAIVASALKNPYDIYLFNIFNIKLIVLKTNSIDEYLKSIHQLGVILNLQQNAENEIKHLNRDLDKLNKEVKEIPYNKRPTVFWEVWNNPLMTAGDSSFLNDYIRLAGGIPVTEGIKYNFFTVSKEWLLIKNPDIIIAPFMSREMVVGLKNKLGWNELSAVKNNRIYTNINPNAAYVLGPDFIATIKKLHEILYSHHQKLPKKNNI